METVYGQVGGESTRGRMNTVRINELARELEVKSREILDALTAVGVTEKKTHSSSIEEHEAERVRAHILKGRGVSPSAGRHESEAKPKIDWSQVHKPGDVARAILEKRQQESAGYVAPHRPAPPVAPPVQAAPPRIAPAGPSAAAPAPPAPRPATPAAPPAAVSAAPASAEAKPAPRRIVPQPRQASAVIAGPPLAGQRPGAPVAAAPPQTPAIAAKPPAGPVVAKPPITAAPALWPRRPPPISKARAVIWSSAWSPRILASSPQPTKPPSRSALWTKPTTS